MKQERSWIVVDLHLHTPASSDYREPEISYLDILRTAKARGLQVIAFSDHNTVAGIRGMQEEIQRLTMLEELDRIRRESKRVREIFAALNPEKIWHSSFQSPVPGAPTSGFGKRSILNGQPRSPHTGTDFDADEGTPVKSPNTGKVILVSPLYYSGNTVILDHGQGLYSYFAHLSRFAVAEGDRVSPGELVGYVGATGRVTGPHLHWTVRLNGTRIDPLSLIAILSDQDAQE